MTNILDNIKDQQKLDKQNVYGSVVELAKQCQHAWDESKDFQVPTAYKKINKIIMTGMGGSGLGARIIESVFASDLKYPLIRINDYDLPHWADKQTLVICSSFSGTTEETISTARQAQQKGCKWMTISTGCTLHQYALENNAPAYKINPRYNPSKEPRMAIGYSVIGQMVMATRAGIINLTQDHIHNLNKFMLKIVAANNREIKTHANSAKKTALKLKQKEIVFVSTRHMTGAAHTVKNQINENAKNLTHRHDVPELNHHLMEGLKFPDSNRENLIFFFVNSNLYPQKIQKRMLITRDVVNKNKVKTMSFKPISKDKLTQAFEFIQWGALVCYYLALLNKLNPAPIPWVDYFKKQLGQPLGQWK